MPRAYALALHTARLSSAGAALLLASPLLHRAARWALPFIRYSEVGRLVAFSLLLVGSGWVASKLRGLPRPVVTLVLGMVGAVLTALAAEQPITVPFLKQCAATAVIAAALSVGKH